MNTRHLLLFVCATVVLGLGKTVAREGKDADKNAPALAPGEYRVEVEVVDGPPNDMGIYRVTVWTAGEQKVELSLADDQPLVAAGKSAPVPGGKLHKETFVVFLYLRECEAGPRKGLAQELEQRLAVGGRADRGVSAPALVGEDAGLKDLVEIAAASGTRKLGSKFPVGKVRGSKVEVRVGEAK